MIDYPQMVFIFGALLLILGLFGGFKIKELNIPPIPKVLRCICFVMGVVFIVTSLLLYMGPIRFPSESKVKEDKNSVTLADSPPTLINGSLIVQNGGYGEGEIRYSSTQKNKFNCEVILQGLKSDGVYVVTINGKENQPGNKELLRFNNWDGKGYWDSGFIKADREGNLIEKLNVELPKGLYNVKFLIKDVNNNYNVILKNDNVQFTIKEEEIYIEFIYPTNEMKISSRGMNVTPITCKGKVIGEIPFKARIKVDILTDRWYPQGIAEIKRDRSWEIDRIYLGGTEHVIRATIIDENENIIISESITVFRIQSPMSPNNGCTDYPITRIIEAENCYTSNIEGCNTGGTWRTWALSGFSKGQCITNESPNGRGNDATLILNFEGIGVIIVYRQDTWYGFLEIEIDGSIVDNINQRGNNIKNGVERCFEAGGMGRHSLVLRGSNEGVITIDAIKILGE